MRGGSGNPDAIRGVLNRFRGQNRDGFGGRDRHHGAPRGDGPVGPHGAEPGGRFMGPPGGVRSRSGFDRGRGGGRGRPLGRGRGRW